jgi:ribosomal-protein-alanine N-acetyltransferase
MQRGERKMQGHPEIETRRMVLRPLALEHAEALHPMFADPDVMRFWHEPPHKDLEDTRAMVRRYHSGTERAWVLCPRDSGDALGLVYYLGNIGAPGLGYILAPRCWRQGLMSEAVQGVLGYGFAELGQDRVELWIDARNLASQRVAERAGFKRRAAFRHKFPHEAASHETLVWGLRADEWRPGASAESGRPTQVYGLQPVLAVPDVRATAEYYREKLGFTIGFMFGEPPTYAGLWRGEWSATGANIHLERAEPPPVQGLSLYINVGPGIDELHSTYKAAGVAMLGEVVQQPWGMREFAIRDCNGYVLRFGTPG